MKKLTYLLFFIFFYQCKQPEGKFILDIINYDKNGRYHSSMIYCDSFEMISKQEVYFHKEGQKGKVIGDFINVRSKGAW